MNDKAIEAAFHAHGNAPVIVDVQTAYNAMRAAIAAYEQAIEPTSDMLTAGARSIGNTASTANHIERAKQCWAAMQAVKLGGSLPPPPGKEG